MQNQAHTESAMRSAALPSAQADSYRGSELAAHLLTTLFRRLPFRIVLRLWNGASVQVGAADAGGPENSFSLVFRNPEGGLLGGARARPAARLAEAYFRGDLDIEGDFFAASRT